MKLTCLVDNNFLPHSSYRGEHGLAFLIEVQGRRVLFDTGASGAVLLTNLDVVGSLPRPSLHWLSATPIQIIPADYLLSWNVDRVCPSTLILNFFESGSRGGKVR
jgi:hypothetical protein